MGHGELRNIYSIIISIRHATLGTPVKGLRMDVPKSTDHGTDSYDKGWLNSITWYLTIFIYIKHCII